MAVHQATASAPVNIACIKYWGKRDTRLILPTNSSLSVTLDQDHLRSTTTSRADPSFEKDRLWLNGKEEEIKVGGRMATCIAELRRMREDLEKTGGEKISHLKIYIGSYNNFPTAAGLASSASGFAALVSSIAALYKLPATPSELSLISRQGSGSACRSLFGGFVAWEMGERADGTDSFAVEVAPREHWSDLHALICVVSDVKKGTSSTSGMQRTVETSELLKHRIKHVVPARMEAIKKAILAKDFNSFATITMQDSNQFHAVCLDTDPPIFYMNDVSRTIIALIVELNRASVAAGGPMKAAYTFDAGPNAVIYAPETNMREIIDLIVGYFPQTETFKDPFRLFANVDGPGKAGLPEGFNGAVAKKHEEGAVKGLIHTRVGGGPRILGDDETLLDASGMPKILT
ncbi:diphosphomevalonate decarboxylase [Tulasnella sp. 330]|nr:diphosphomevalonate decarboxylase [Tulasnella sp. 330]KAG8881493.1 diphosphomevalonate decarboxylase [Tulasnella sp. 331]KAG8887571.1 diphosphomevalonate decarboxylase [Tulasnella sp. 332]